MRGPTHRLRTRLLLAMLAVAVSVLVLAAVGAAVLARQTASDAALRELERRAPAQAAAVQGLTEQIRSQPVNAVAARRLRRELVALLAASGVSTFTINEDGTVTQGAAGLLGPRAAANPSTLLDLPKDLRLDQVDLVRIVAGSSESGVDGNQAYVAVPLEPVAGNTPVVVVTQEVEQRPLGRAGRYLVFTGAAALLLAAFASAFLARRLSHPIVAMDVAANRIASGDLSARVDADHGPDDEVARLTRSFNTMADELERARGLERAFLLSVSHDLRTPLTSIRGYAEAIADGTIEGTEARGRAARVIDTEARRLERLVADLLDLARLDAHEFSLQPRPVDAREVVDTTVAAFLPAAREYAVALDVEPGEPMPVDADPERLAQIVANLVENALKYARSRVTVAVAHQGPDVEIAVADDGPGVPEAERNRVFERLHTARPVAGRPVGTGIGLAIVRELAQAMGGAACCADLTGSGTRFVVTIPIGPAVSPVPSP